MEECEGFWSGGGVGVVGSCPGGTRLGLVWSLGVLGCRDGEGGGGVLDAIDGETHDG